MGNVERESHRRKCLGSGDPPGLQNRRSSLTGDGVFDSHALPPAYMSRGKFVRLAAMFAGILFEPSQIQDCHIAIIHRNQPHVFEPSKSSRHYVSYGPDPARDFMVGEAQPEWSVNVD